MISAKPLFVIEQTGTKNRKNVEISIILNCIEFGVPSVLGKDEEGITYRVPYNELEAIGIKE